MALALITKERRRARAVEGVNQVVARAVILTRLGETVVNHVTQFTCNISLLCFTLRVTCILFQRLPGRTITYERNFL